MVQLRIQCSPSLLTWRFPLSDSKLLKQDPPLQNALNDSSMMIVSLYSDNSKSETSSDALTLSRSIQLSSLAFRTHLLARSSSTITPETEYPGKNINEISSVAFPN